jgi:predicted TIM-barrel fold metal-dependent hydrolase
LETDGIVGEILYPTLGLAIFAIEDPDLQAACCRRYNEWLLDYCSIAPDRLFAIGMIPTYEMDVAQNELKFCADRGMRGCIIWQTPHPDIPFSTDHYDSFWAAAQDLSMPVSLHIVTGFNYSRQVLTTCPPLRGTQQWDSTSTAPPASNLSVFRNVRQKLDCVVDALSDIIFSGVFDRYPQLRLVLAENEVGWLPFVLDQFDYYARGKREINDPELAVSIWPSDYVTSNVFVTFFRDPLAGSLPEGWGHDNCMWSNDFPHANSTWPHSRETVSKILGALPNETIEKLVWGNAARLYRF